MKKVVVLYALITQFIVTMIALALGGWWLGSYLEPETNLNIQLAGVGVGIAFMVNIILFYLFFHQYNRMEENEKKLKQQQLQESQLDQKIKELSDTIEHELEGIKK